MLSRVSSLFANFKGRVRLRSAKLTEVMSRGEGYFRVVKGAMRPNHQVGTEPVNEHCPPMSAVNVLAFEHSKLRKLVRGHIQL